MELVYMALSQVSFHAAFTINSHVISPSYCNGPSSFFSFLYYLILCQPHRLYDDYKWSIAEDMEGNSYPVFVHCPCVCLEELQKATVWTQTIPNMKLECKPLQCHIQCYGHLLPSNHMVQCLLHKLIVFQLVK